MEKIKLAIEKARQQNSTIGAAAAQRAPKEKEIDVDYLKTDVVELDPEHLERNRILAFTKDIPNHAAFDILRTKVIQKMDENGWRTLAITSPSQAAGKSVISINLAISLARQTHRTAMLVDFDLRRPQIGSYLGVKKDISLNEVLVGKATLAEAMLNPSLPRLVILPTNRPEPKSAELLSSPQIGQMITDLRERYQERIVLFDLPPMLASDDAMAVLPKMDCVLVIIGNGMSNKREIEECMRHVPRDKLLGVVMNKAEGRPDQHYYY
jgi:capsular exopolysaccharide synthesis family protein